MVDAFFAGDLPSNRFRLLATPEGMEETSIFAFLLVAETVFAFVMMDTEEDAAAEPSLDFTLPAEDVDLALPTEDVGSMVPAV